MKIEITCDEAKVVIRALAALCIIRPEHDRKLFELSNKFMDVLEPDLGVEMPDWWFRKAGVKPLAPNLTMGGGCDCDGWKAAEALDAGNVAPPQAVSGSIEDVRNYSIRPAPGAKAGALKGCLVVCAEIREPHLFGSHCINARLAYPGDVCGYCRRPYLTMGGGCDCDGWKAAEALDAGAEKARETGNYSFSEIAKTSTDAGTVLEAAPASAPITYSEGKKIYDQGWNDGIDHFLKTFNLMIEQRFRNR